jgi:hypothetical protein
MAWPSNAYVISTPPLAGEVGGVGLPTEGSGKANYPKYSFAAIAHLSPSTAAETMPPA